MGISDRILGKKNVNGDRTSSPSRRCWRCRAAKCALQARIASAGIAAAARALWRSRRRGRHQFGSFLVARVPEGASSGPVVVPTNGHVSNAHTIKVAVPIAENLHPGDQPRARCEGNIYVTFSGSRGQKVPVAIFKIDTNYNVKPFVAEMMNATAIAFDREDRCTFPRATTAPCIAWRRTAPCPRMPRGWASPPASPLIANQNLYVGDRSGTIFKIGRDRQIFVFATLEPSVSAYHLAFGPQGDLFVTGPTTSSFDCVYKIDPQGTVHDVLPRTGTPAGPGFRCDGQSVCGGFALGQARHREDHARRQSQPGSRRARAGGSGLCSGAMRDSGDHRRSASSFVEHSGAATVAGVAFQSDSSPLESRPCY